MESTFDGVVAFALMASMIVVGGMLRKRFAFLKRSLVPTSILGGLVGFMLLSFDLIPGYSPADFSALAFHFFTLSFMSLCLIGSSKDDSLSGGSIIKGGLWLTAIWTASLGIQAIIGYGMVYGYSAVTGKDIHALLGGIITHGFTQGPGQALTYGSIWESEYGIVNATQVGLIYASIGFLAAFLVGVPTAKGIIRRGLNLNKKSAINATFLEGFYSKEETISTGRMVAHNANMDSYAWHLGLLAIAYGITHIWLRFMQGAVGDYKPFGVGLDVLFSHNMFFVHGLGVAILMRFIIDKAGWENYVDNDTFKRITGASVDFMVVGTLMSISFTVLYALLVPILLVSVAVTAVTFFLTWYVAKLSGKLGPERAITSFGCCTGSTGTGLLLLRLVDADFSTSVAKELAFFNIAIIVLNIPVLFIIAPIAPSLSASTYLLAFGATAIIPLLFIPLLMLSGKGRKAGASTKIAVAGAAK